MAKKILTTPIQKSDLEGIKPGDVIYLTGHITTCRDMGHRRVVEEGKTLPVDVKDVYKRQVPLYKRLIKFSIRSEYFVWCKG